MNIKGIYALFCMLIVTVFFSISVGFVGDFMKGFDAGVKEANSNAWLAFLVPNDYSNSEVSVRNFGELINGEPEVEVAASKLNVVLRGDFTQTPTFRSFNRFYLISSFIVTIAVIVMFVVMIQLFIRIHKAIKAKTLFSLKIVRSLRVLGVTLIIQVAFSALFMYYQNIVAQMALSKYGYVIDKSIEIEYIYLVFGFSLLLIAEVFKIGHKIEEEQNLTV